MTTSLSGIDDSFIARPKAGDNRQTKFEEGMDRGDKTMNQDRRLRHTKNQPRRPLREILLWPLLALALGHPLSAQPSESLRLGFYNTFLRSPMMYCLQSWENLPDCLVQYDEVPEDNAEQAAQELISLGLDVIALGEVFDESARDILSLRMATAGYVHQVRKLDDALVVIEIGGDAPEGPFPMIELEDPIKFNLEDSGLMLFSRFPFVPLPNDDYQANGDYLEATTDEVAFVRFSATADYDMLSAKGAGLVRVQNPSSGEIYTVVFSHMQADYAPDYYFDVRAEQFEDIRRMIINTLGTDDLSQNSVFFLGDFNVKGEGAMINGYGHNGSTGIPTDDWIDRFGSGFFFEQLVDSWASQTSRDDLGLTHPSSGQRLDYIAASRGRLQEGFCIQHLTRKQVANSDHWLVAADYNWDARFCDPRSAWIQPPLDQFLNGQFIPGQDVTAITNPGGAQWFRIDLPTDNTTVSVGFAPGDEYDVTGNGVIAELYDPTDLSVPVAQYDELTVDLQAVGLDVPRGTTGKTYIVPERFFIKVYSPNRQWTGDYSLLIHEHTCTTPEDACALLPAQPRRYEEFQANVLVGQHDQAWFRLNVESADSGDAQHLNLFLRDYIKDVFELDVRDVSNPTQTVPGYSEISHGHGKILWEAHVAQGSPVFLVVKRTDPTWGDVINVGWETNLTVLHGANGPPGSLQLRLFCLDETNPELGSDEIRLKMSVDGGPLTKVFARDYECNDGDVSYSVENAVGTVRFLESVSFQVVEDDDTSSDDTSPIWSVATLDPGQSETANAHLEWEFSGGHYRLEFNLGRTLNGGN